MKKTLVALAVLAASGASFSQVVISGKLGFSVQKTAGVATTAATQGMQMTDGDVGFAATEDLGGGYSAKADTRIKLRGRDTTVTARDAKISLTTPVAMFEVGAVEAGPLLANAWAGAPVTSASGPDGLVIDGYSNVDFASVTLPMGAFTAAAAFLEVGASDDGMPASTFGATTSPYSATTGTGGNRTGISGYQLVAAYNAGPVSVTADYTMFMAAKGVSELFDGHNRARIAGTYDLGVAKVGLGFQSKNKSVASQYSAGVSAPLGAVTLGLVYNGRNKQDVVLGDTGATLVAAADSRSSTSAALKYNLSKTTDVTASYTVYSGVGSVNGSAQTSDNEYRIRLMKAF